MVLLQAEGDVVTALAPVSIELRSLTERDCAAGVASVPVHAEAKMLAVAHSRELTELAAGCEQGDVGVAETKRRQAAKLATEIERQVRAAREHDVDLGGRDEVVRC